MASRDDLARTFLGTGADYERYRPGFPEEAARLLLPDAVEAVLDLGAGTGKLTEQLVGRARHVTAVDPSEPMLAELRRKLPGVTAIVGAAESIPLDDASQDVVAVAQAFHWFRRDEASAEIGRVLRPGGTLGLIWNASDPACAWDWAAYRIAHPEASVAEDAERGMPQVPGLVPVAEHEVRWVERLSREHYLRRWLTVSSLLAADGPTRAVMLARVEQVLDDDDDTRGRTALELPMVTAVLLYRSPPAATRTERT